MIIVKKPKIRFKGFTETWEQRKLGSICKITMGQSPNGSTYSETPCDYILVQGNADLKDGWVVPRIWTSQITKTAKSGDLIMSVRAPAGAIGKTAYDVVIGRGVASINGNEFIYQTLKKYEIEGYWKKIATGSTFESINSEDINDTILFVPIDDSEQKQIGSLFSKLDHFITLHQCKYFTICNKNRFAWEQRKLENYLEVSHDKNKDNLFDKNDVLSVSGDYGIVNQIEFQGRSFAGNSVSNYGVVRKGDIVYTKSPLKSNPFGIIKTNCGNTGIVSTLYAVYHPKDNVISNFVQIYFEQNVRMNNYMRPLVNKGAKNDMKVTSENALKGLVYFPKCEEQKEISNLFAVFDNLITLHQSKCDKLKEVKKYMLQNMFI